MHPANRSDKLPMKFCACASLVVLVSSIAAIVVDAESVSRTTTLSNAKTSFVPLQNIKRVDVKKGSPADGSFRPPTSIISNLSLNNNVRSKLRNCFTKCASRSSKFTEHYMQLNDDNNTPPNRPIKEKQDLPVAQRINNWLHVSPQSQIVESAYWSFLLILIAPLMGLVVLLKDVLYESVTHATDTTATEGNKNEDHNNNITPTMAKKELGVLVTGCDSGFGQLLAYELSKRPGYVVFATCLTPKGEEQYSNIENVHTIPMDVTNQESVDAAVSVVQSWLMSDDKESGKDDDTTSQENNKYLHAIVNNAGLGTPSLIDWQDISVFEKTMSVNFFGVVRVTKAFLPILKYQSAGLVPAIMKDKSTNQEDKEKEKPPHFGRIINMSSIAGKTAGQGTASYAASKHALEAFTSSLKTELEDFNIGVVAVNPSFHETQMTDTMCSQLAKSFEITSPSMQEEYGEEYFRQMEETWKQQQELVLWDPMNVVNAVLTNIDEKQTGVKDLPKNVLVGADARFLLYPLSLIPPEVSSDIFRTISKLAVGNNSNDDASGIKPNLMVQSTKAHNR